jgi:histidyl-tRNA synthetase
MLEPVRGMRDVLPEQRRVLADVQARLETEIARWGYQMIDLPILERRELYLKKSGEELVGKLYDFTFGGRSVALRPEWTASVLRAYLNELQSEPLPLRLAYSGPVFRYERPQRVTYRQFTQVGVELIGGAAPLADAEIIALACRGLRAVGVDDYKVTIGHIGIVRALLNGLGLAERTANFLLWNMERLREGDDTIREQLAAAQDEELFDLGPLADLPDEQLEALLLTMLRAVGLRLDNSTRQPEAIVGRLVRKLRRADPQPSVERALHLLTQLAATRGAPEAMLPKLEQLLAAEGIDPASLNELRAILHVLEGQIDAGKLIVDAGLGRGLHYYTGLIFEVNAGNGLQLCGGGRYDDLVTSLGGRSPVPAIGFAYGLERVADATGVERRASPTTVLVMAEDQAAFGSVLATAEQLRKRGYIAVVDVRSRSFAANQRDAARRGVAAIVVCDERAPELVHWYDLETRSERVLTATEWPEGSSR